MADRMRLMELCLRECAATFGWGLSGNYLTSSRGYLSFNLVPTLSDDGIDYALSYRYTAFDRIYHALTSAAIFPGATVDECMQPVDAWGLMGVSTAMRTLTGRADKFTYALAERIVNTDDNLRFLEFLSQRSVRMGRRPMKITAEQILTCLLTGDTAGAVRIANAALVSGDTGDGFYTNVLSYIRRHGG